MGLYDRDYAQSEFRQRHGLPQMRFSLPRMTPGAKWLLTVNIAVFVLCLVPSLGIFLENWFALDTRSWLTILEPWRLVSYQFLHSRVDVWHIVVNMIGLFFLAPPLERHWGSKRFVLFYLSCGLAGGLLYIALAAAGLVHAGILVGASGAVLGVIAACAILFPHFNLVFFIFPVPIRIAAVCLILISMVNMLTGGSNAGGDAAHLGGAVAGAAYILLLPSWGRLTMKLRAGSWEKRMEQSHRLQIEVDRILAKVHRQGLHSLTAAEKRILKRATQEEIRRQRL
jgi:membrane associated rhomboid family serine protease